MIYGTIFALSIIRTSVKLRRVNRALRRQALLDAGVLPTSVASSGAHCFDVVGKALPEHTLVLWSQT